MAPARRRAALALGLASVIFLAGCSSSSNDLGSLIGQKLSTIQTTSTSPNTLGRIVLHVPGEVKLGKGLSGGNDVIVAICSTAPTVYDAQQVNVGVVGEAQLTKQILANARAGKYQHLISCDKRVHYHP